MNDLKHNDLKIEKPIKAGKSDFIKCQQIQIYFSEHSNFK